MFHKTVEDIKNQMKILELKNIVREIKTHWVGSTPEDREKNRWTWRENRNYTIWTTEKKLDWKIEMNRVSAKYDLPKDLSPECT